MTTRPGLVLLSGLPGVGKTYFARGLAGSMPVTHIESDAVRRGLFIAPRYSAWESAYVFREVERLAREAIGAGEIALIDATNLTHGDRRRFFALAKKVGVPFVSVLLVAPDAVIRARLAAPREGYSQATVAVYDHFRDRAQPFRTPRGGGGYPLPSRA